MLWSLLLTYFFCYLLGVVTQSVYDVVISFGRVVLIVLGSTVLFTLIAWITERMAPYFFYDYQVGFVVMGLAVIVQIPLLQLFVRDGSDQRLGWLRWIVTYFACLQFVTAVGLIFGVGRQWMSS